VVGWVLVLGTFWGIDGLALFLLWGILPGGRSNVLAFGLRNRRLQVRTLLGVLQSVQFGLRPDIHS
jgi:hypothetical protein